MPTRCRHHDETQTGGSFDVPSGKNPNISGITKAEIVTAVSLAALLVVCVALVAGVSQ